MNQTPHTISPGQRRPLGGAHLTIAPLVVGTMARHGDERAVRLAIYEQALERGLTTFDTAPLYGFGAAERLLGEAIRRAPRDAVQILGKVGLRWDTGDHGEVLFEADDGAGGRRQVRRDSRPESIRTEVVRSLERLGTDYLDLVQIHQPDLRTPIDETMGALLDLHREGRVRHIGVSNFSSSQIEAARRALGEVPLSSVQADYSLLQRSIEAEVLPVCRGADIGVLAYSPLAAGWLARCAPGDLPAPGLRRAQTDVLQPMAERYGVSPAAVAIAWVLARAGVAGAIAGVSQPQQLLEQAGAVGLRLSPADERHLEVAFAGLVRPDLAARGGRFARTVRRARRLAGGLLRRLGVDPAAVSPAARRRKW